MTTLSCTLRTIPPRARFHCPAAPPTAAPDRSYRMSQKTRPQGVERHVEFLPAKVAIAFAKDSGRPTHISPGGLAAGEIAVADPSQRHGGPRVPRNQTRPHMAPAQEQRNRCKMCYFSEINPARRNGASITLISLAFSKNEFRTSSTKRSHYITLNVMILQQNVREPHVRSHTLSHFLIQNGLL